MSVLLLTACLIVPVVAYSPCLSLPPPPGHTSFPFRQGCAVELSVRLAGLLVAVTERVCSCGIFCSLPKPTWPLVSSIGNRGAERHLCGVSMSASECDYLMPTTPASTRHEDRKDEGKESGGNKIKREPEDQGRGTQEKRGPRTIHRLHTCAQGQPSLHH